jgi:hypothetical protein
MKQRETKDPIPELYGLGRLSKLTNFKQRRSTKMPDVALFIMPFYYALAGAISPAVRQ